MVNKDFHNYKWTDVDLLLDKYLDIEWQKSDRIRISQNRISAFNMSDRLSVTLRDLRLNGSRYRNTFNKIGLMAIHRKSLNVMAFGATVFNFLGIAHDAWLCLKPLGM